MPETNKPEVKKPDAKKPAAKPTEPHVVRQLNDKVQLTAARFTPCGTLLVGCGFFGGVFRWNVAAEEVVELEPLAGHGGFVQGPAFGPAGTMYTGDSWGRLRAWKYAEPRPAPLWDLPQAHDGWLRDVVVAPDGKTLATCGRDGFVRLRNSAEGKLLREWRHANDDVFALAFSPDGKLLASGDLYGRVTLRDVATGNVAGELDAKILAKLDRLQDVGGVRLLRFAPDGKRLLVGGTQPKNGGNVQGTPTLIEFDVAAAKQLQVVDLGSGYVYVCDVQFLPDGARAVVLSGNPGSGKLALFKPGETKPYFETTKLFNCHAVSVHPSGKQLAVTAVNSNTSGNGRVKGKNGEMDYPGNWSPVHLVELPDADRTA